MRRPALVLLMLLGTLPAAAAGTPPGVPPDGAAGPTVPLAEIVSGSLPWGATVTTPLVTVVNVSCPDCASATNSADFIVRDANGTTLRVHVSHSWQATYNVKKQLFVPAVGMQVVAQGRVEKGPEGWFVNAKRWGEVTHDGVHATLGDIAAGVIPTGTFVWVDGARVLNVGHWDDGDYSFDLGDGSGGNLFVHAEMGPPFWGQLRIPHANDTVNPYGMVRFDPDHGWWEIHPIRCWSPAECAPARVDYLRNGPPPGTPATGGVILDGAPRPGEANDTHAEDAPRVTFTLVEPAANVTVRVASPQTPTSVEASLTLGPWLHMQLRAGAWVLDQAVANGTPVRFRARLPDGAGATSGTFLFAGNGTEISDPAPPLQPGEAGPETPSATTPSSPPLSPQQSVRSSPMPGLWSVVLCAALSALVGRARGSR